MMICQVLIDVFVTGCFGKSCNLTVFDSFFILFPVTYFILRPKECRCLHQTFVFQVSRPLHGHGDIQRHVWIRKHRTPCWALSLWQVSQEGKALWAGLMLLSSRCIIPGLYFCYENLPRIRLAPDLGLEHQDQSASTSKLPWARGSAQS